MSSACASVTVSEGSTLRVDVETHIRSEKAVICGDPERRTLTPCPQVGVMEIMGLCESHTCRLMVVEGVGDCDQHAKDRSQNWSQ